MKCILTRDTATRFECFLGLNSSMITSFDPKQPRAPSRNWKTTCPPNADEWKDGFYISGQILFRPWCEECYKVIQFSSPSEIPENIRNAIQGDSYDTIRKIIRKRFGFTPSSKSEIVECVSKHYPKFSEQGVFAVAFIVVAISRVKGIISPQDITVKKTATGLFIKEFSKGIAQKIENQNVFESIPNFSEAEMIDFVKTKTNWSLKKNDESYSLEDLADQYYSGLGEFY